MDVDCGERNYSWKRARALKHAHTRVSSSWTFISSQVDIIEKMVDSSCVGDVSMVWHFIGMHLDSSRRRIVSFYYYFFIDSQCIGVSPILFRELLFVFFFVVVARRASISLNGIERECVDEITISIESMPPLLGCQVISYHIFCAIFKFDATNNNYNSNQNTASSANEIDPFWLHFSVETFRNDFDLVFGGLGARDYWHVHRD